MLNKNGLSMLDIFYKRPLKEVIFGFELNLSIYRILVKNLFLKNIILCITALLKFKFFQRVHLKYS